MYLFLHFYQESQLDYSTCVLTQKSTKSSLTLIKNRHKLHVQTGVPVPKVKFPRVRVAWFTAEWAPKQNEAFEPGRSPVWRVGLHGFSTTDAENWSVFRSWWLWAMRRFNSSRLNFQEKQRTVQQCLTTHAVLAVNLVAEIFGAGCGLWWYQFTL